MTIGLGSTTSRRRIACASDGGDSARDGGARTELRAEGSHIEAERLEQRTTADVGLLEELGWCPGAEHYSRHLAGRAPGDPPVTLLDYLNFDARRRDLDANGREGGAHREGGDANRHRRGWLLVADESHVMLPQLRAMHGGDRSRKRNLVAGGYRLPSALDNRPLTFDEFWERVPQALLVSATPGEMETAWCAAESEATGDPPDHAMVDMVVRPSGVLDPTVTVLPREGQLPALAGAIRERAARGEASLVCALTKADCEDLAGYLNHVGGIRADWLHSELPAPRRAEKLQRLQRGEIDCVVGAQLLREGLDLPQVSLVAVLDAGVPGFMRSSRSLMQMMGRAARNASGECILFADAPYTRAMLEATEEVARRRRKQEAHNAKHGIVPTNASQGSPSATLSLFEVMAEEIAAERDSAAATAAARAEANPNVSAISGVSGRDRFTPTEEEVQTALRAWRLEREGVADARAAAEAAAAAASDAADALSDDVGECGVRSADVSPSGVSRTRCSQTRGRVAPTTPSTPTPRPARVRRRHSRRVRGTLAPSAPSPPPLAIRRSARSRPRGWRTSTSATFAAPSRTCPRRRGCTVGSPRTGPCCTWARRRIFARARGGTSRPVFFARVLAIFVWRRARGSWTRCSPPGARRTRWRSKRGSSEDSNPR